MNLAVENSGIDLWANYGATLEVNNTDLEDPSIENKDVATLDEDKFINTNTALYRDNPELSNQYALQTSSKNLNSKPNQRFRDGDGVLVSGLNLFGLFGNGESQGNQTEAETEQLNSRLTELEKAETDGTVSDHFGHSKDKLTTLAKLVAQESKTEGGDPTKYESKFNETLNYANEHLNEKSKARL